MTDIERIALAIALIHVQMAELLSEIHQLRGEVQDCKDVYRNCACFGVTTTEVP